MIVEKQNSNEGVYIPDNLTQNLTLRTIQQMANVNFTEPLQSFFRRKKQNQKEKSIEITPTNDLAFQHTADVIHPCNKPV